MSWWEIHADGVFGAIIVGMALALIACCCGIGYGVTYLLIQIARHIGG